MSKSIIHIILGCCLIGGIHSCIEQPDTQPNTFRGNFESLWEIIDTRYCYLDYKEIDWDSVYYAFSPRVDTVSSVTSFFDLMGEMLAELKDGHVNLYSEFDVSRYWEWYNAYPSNFDSDLLSTSRYLGNNYRIAGGLKYKSIADGQVGYIYYSSFSSGFSSANIKAIFERFVNCKGLIVDIRNNSGGYLSNSELLASYFFTEKTLTGYIRHKTGNGHSDFSEPTAVYTNSNEKIRWERPVIILTNRLCYSSTNDFVCRMKYAPKATIVGAITGGGGGLPLSSELPCGWMLRFSASPMYNAQMENTEWGIEPDTLIDMNVVDMQEGYDSIIEKAIELILNELKY